MSQGSENKNIALIVAAGRGHRFSASDSDTAIKPLSALPKQYQPLNGMPVLQHTLKAFENHHLISHILTVIHPDDADLYIAASQGITKCLPPVFGGVERQISVFEGLKALQDINPKCILVHDAARPYLSKDLISRILAALETSPSVIPVLPLTDTVKLFHEDQSSQTLPRDLLKRVQTPQGFDYATLLEVHEKATKIKDLFTDDASLVEHFGIEVVSVDGDEKNIKLTVESDLMETLEYRTGLGFDAHRFTNGDHVMLCGVNIPHDRSLEGHSDADVALHALTDALMGALAAGDIGEHFPMSDARNIDRNSEDFLKYAANLATKQRAHIVNIDLTIICESPKISPYREKMVHRLATILDMPENRISVKATTTEKMGFTGRSEGIAAQAVISIALPIGL
ncbi:MAG: bifunctional 2-C-methyl-D-erythritol 4-phosphate cytidylyltransferase/2-C-methyl-D-erythritol 2,4-cyclodiphosphate synthase [Pseudomonadota bacterium]|nr:bifunctional 2-C-methyl-D-erythritol 4-phosphate cytidylyltransferase/2-C-methyl-D-erythritol 2,4-cyclodiphosphate synthase [Pseudomonadota bacterium]